MGADSFIVEMLVTGGSQVEAGQDLIVVHAANLARPLLDDRLSKRHLTVTGHDGPAFMSDGKNGRAVMHRVAEGE